MFNKKSLKYILVMFILLISIGIASASDIENISLEDTNLTDNMSLSEGNVLVSDSINEYSENEITHPNDTVTSQHSSYSHVKMSSILYALNFNYDLAISIKAQPQISNYLNYTITVSNNCTRDFHNIVANFNLPSSITILNISREVETLDNLSFIWKVGNLSAGRSLSLNVYFKINNTQTLDISANVSGDEGDVNLVNNFDRNIYNPILFGTFTELQELVDTSVTYVHIDKNYAYDYQIDDYDTFVAGINIDRPLTIIGSSPDYIISGNNRVGVFNVLSSAINTRFINLTIVNGYFEGGGAIHVFADNVDIYNLNFYNNTANGAHGGAVYVEGNNFMITSSTFIDNTVSQAGGALAARDNVNIIIFNNIFVRNTVVSNRYFGGALGFINVTNVNVSNNVFVDNIAVSNRGSTIYSSDVNNFYLDENWFGTNDVDIVSDKLFYGDKPSSWFVLDFNLVNASNMFANFLASWYLYDSVNDSCIEYNGSLPRRSFTVKSNTTNVITSSPNYLTDKTIIYYVYPNVDKGVNTLTFRVDNQEFTCNFSSILTITKTVDNNESIAGDNLTFYINVSNFGPNNATDVVIRDVIPAGVTFVSATGNFTGVYRNGEVTWTIDTLPRGTTAELFLTVLPMNEGDYVNEVDLTTSNPYDVFLEDSSSVNYTIVPGVDLLISIGVSNFTTFVHEAGFEVTLTAYNGGPDIAYNISTVLSISPDFSFVRSVGRGVYDNLTNVWFLDSLGVNRLVYITLTFVANLNGNYTLSVNTTSDVNESKLENNNASVNITVLPSSDLTINVTVSDFNPSYDPVNMRNITYTIFVRNDGVNNDTNVNVSFAVPSGLLYLNHTPGLTFDSTSNIWHIGDLNSGSSAELNVTFGVTSPGFLNLYLNISGDLIDENYTNNYINITVEGSTNDLNVTILFTDNLPYYYEIMGISIVVCNSGPSIAKNVSVKFSLPDILTFVSANSTDYSVSTGLWDIGNLSSGESIELYIRFNVTFIGNISLFTSVNNSIIDVDYDNNNYTLNFTSTESADLVVNAGLIFQTPPDFYMGEDCVYVVNVTNKGPNNATNVSVYIDIPPQLAYLSDNSRGAFNRENHIWTIGNLNLGRTVELRMNLTTLTNGTYNITSNVSHGEFDRDLDNNFISSEFTIIPLINLALNVTPSLNKTVLNGIMTFKVSVKNYGPSNATGVSVGFLMDNSFVTSSSSPIVIPFLRVGQEYVFDIKVNTTKLGVFYPYFNVWGSEVEFDLMDNDVTLNISVAYPIDLSVSINVDNPNPTMGENVTYIITVSNKMNSVPHNIFVDIPLPYHLRYITSIGASGEFDKTTNRWNIESLDAGNSTSLKLICRVLGENITTLNISVDADEFDINLTDNVANATVNAKYAFLPDAIDLDLKLEVDNSTPSIYSKVNYILTVTNIGNGPASMVKIPLNISENLTDVTITNGIIMGGNWIVGTLNPGDVQQLYISGTVISFDGVILSAFADSPEFDLNLNNNLATISVDTIESCDLTITMDIDTYDISEGDNIVFYITVSNNGYCMANNVKVQIDIPSWTISYPDYTSFDELNGIWTIGTLDPGQVERLSVSLTAIPGTFSYHANISSNTFDVNMSNNYANVSFTALSSANLIITLVSNATEGYLGDYITYTVSILNNGSGEAHNVYVYTNFTSTVNYNTSAGLYDVSKNIWSLDTLAPNQFETFNIILPISENFTEYYANATTTTHDYDLSNNYKLINVSVKKEFDLDISINVSDFNVSVGNLVEFLIIVKNIGEIDASDVIADLSKMPLVSSTVTKSKGEFNTFTGIWTIGNLAPGEEVYLNLTHTIGNIGSITYNASVRSRTNEEHIISNNNVSVTIESDDFIDVGIKITVNETEPIFGTTVKYTVNVTNYGFADLLSVCIRNDINGTVTVPFGHMYINGIWIIPTLKAESSVIMEIVSTIESIGLITQSAWIEDTFSDPDLSNNVDNITVNVSSNTDLEVLITGSDDNPYIGDIYNFTVTIINRGPVTAFNISVNTTLPVSLDYEKSSGYYNTLTGLWLVDELKAGFNETLNLYYVLNETGSFEYFVSANMSNNDTNISNNDDKLNFTTLELIDLNIVIDYNEFYYINDNATFTVKVSNIGLSNATNVKVDLVFPFYATFNTTNGTYSNNVWDIGSLAIGEEVSLTVEYVIDSNDNGRIFDAKVTGFEKEFNESNNIFIVNLTVYPIIDLNVTITSNLDSYTYGEILFFNITAYNKGPVNASNINVSLSIPDGFNLIFNMTNNGVFDNNLWNIAFLRPRSSALLILRFNTTNIGYNTLNASIISNIHEITEEDNNVSKTIFINTTCDLSISITTIPGVFNPDGSVGIIVNVLNKGPYASENTIVSFNFPLSFDYTLTNGYYDPLNNTWFIRNLDVGDIESFVINLNITNFTQIFNGTMSSDISDFNLSNNLAELYLNILPLSDLAVNITVNQSEIYINENITFIVNVTNNGPNIAYNINVTLDIPTPISYECEGTFNTLINLWTISKILPGETKFLLLNLTLNTSGNFTYNATVTGEVNDTISSNNKDVVFVTVNPSTDLILLMESNLTTFYINDEVSFTITILNNGSFNDKDIDVFVNLSSLPIPLPASMSWSAGSFDLTSSTWRIYTLENNTNATLTISGTINDSGDFSLFASVNGTLLDTDKDNNNQTLTFNVIPLVDLIVSINVTNTSQYLGENITITVQVLNNASSVAENVILTTNLPKGEYIKNKGLYDRDSGIWYIGTLGAYEVVELNITFNVYENTTYIFNVENTILDINPSNNNVSVNITYIDSVDLGLIVFIDNGEPYIGDTLNYTIFVYNNGLSNAENISILTSLHLNDFEILSVDGDFNETTGVFTIGTLDSMTNKTLSILFNLNNSGLFINNFSVNSTVHDLNNLNDNLTVNVYVNGSERPNYNYVDLIVNITLNNTLSSLGDELNFTVYIYNAGPNIAHNVSISNILPNNLTIISLDYGNDSFGNWTFDNLGVNETIVLNFTAISSDYINALDEVIVNSKELDSNPTNNRAGVPIIILTDKLNYNDLSVDVVSIFSNLTSNGSVVFNISVRNSGLDNGSDVNLSVNLADNLIIDSYILNNGSFNNNIWSIGRLNVNETVNLILTVNITSLGYFVNTFFVWDENIETNPVDNNFVYTIIVNDNFADIGVNIRAESNILNISELTSFYVTVYNSGLMDASNVNLSIILPLDMDIISSNDSNFNISTGEYYIGNFPIGSRLSFVFMGLFNKSGIKDIYANLTLDENDRYLPDNEYSLNLNVVEPVITKSADIEISVNVNKDAINSGDSVTLIFTVTNHGPDNATNVIVTPMLPENSVINSHSPFYWDYNIGEYGGFIIPNLAVNQSINILSMEVTFNQNKTFVFNATAFADENDPDRFNNFLSHPISSKLRTQIVDLDLKLTTSTSKILINDTVTYSLVINNLGTDTAHNVVLSNVLPDGFELVSASEGYAIGSGWYIGNISGKSPGVVSWKYLNITAKIVKSGVFLNTFVASCDEQEFNSTNNARSEAVLVNLPNPNVDNITTTVKIVSAVGSIRVTNAKPLAVNASLLDNESNPIANQVVTLSVVKSTGGTRYQFTATTDSNGIAEFSVVKSYLSGGNYKLTLTYDGDEVGNNRYLPSNTTSTVRITLG